MVNIVEFAHVLDLLDRAASPDVVDRALRSEGLNRKVVKEGPGFLPQRLEAGIVEYVARAIGDPHLGARMAPAFDYAIYGAYARYVLGARDLGNAIDRVRRALPLIYPGSEIVLRHLDGHLIVGRKFVLTSVVGCRHLDDDAIFIIGQVMRHFLGLDWRPDWIEVRCEAAANADYLEETTGAPVLSGCEMPAVALRSHDLAAANPEPPSAEQVVSFMDLPALMGIQPPRTMADAVEQVLRTQLVVDDLAEESVARRLSMGRRTLRRALKAEATSFREVKGQFIEARARTLLSESELDVETIAQSLGYSEPNSFRRAFRTWSGFTPRSYRAR